MKNSNSQMVDVFSEGKLAEEYSHVKGAVMVITPELAIKWLARSNSIFKNRPISTGTVDRYVNDIQNGKWNTNGEAIIIDPYGAVLDGRHRLTAIATANISVISLVVQGIDKSTFPTINSGRNRTASEALFIEGVENNKLVANILSSYNALEQGLAIMSSEGNRNIVSSGKVGNKNLLVVEQTRGETELPADLLMNAVEYAEFINKKVKGPLRLGITPGNIGGTILHCIQKKGYTLNECQNYWDELLRTPNFETKLASGAITTNTTITAARTKLADFVGNKSKARLKAQQLQNYVAVAWNAWADGKQNARITFKNTAKIDFKKKSDTKMGKAKE